MILVILGRHCENVVVWKPGNLNTQQQRELYVEPGEMRFSSVFAMTGDGRNSSESLFDDPDD